MSKRFQIKRIVTLMFAIGVTSNAMASGFQLWEQDAASVGNYHAGRAVDATDASIGYYNPAGLTHIKNQQLVVGDVFVASNIQYRGNVSSLSLNSNAQNNANAEGGAFSPIPNIHYAAPLADNLSFGLNLSAPFGLKTDWGRSTAVRYAATSTEIAVADLSPSLGFNIGNKLSLGAGIDFQRLAASFNTTVANSALGPNSDTWSHATGVSTARGFHLGVMFQLQESTRIGLAYHSQVVHHINGTSKLVGPIADFANRFNGGVAPTNPPGPVISEHAKAAITLPPTTALSIQHKLDPKWVVNGSLIYTQWSTVQNIVLRNSAAAGLSGFGTPVPVTNFTYDLPQHYRNTFNFSVGADYTANEKMTLRGGVGYDQTPTRDRYRNVIIPDNDRVAVAVGGRYQATKTFAFDLGWTHLFMFKATNVAPPMSSTGVTTQGRVNASADIFGAQVKWDMA